MVIQCLFNFGKELNLLMLYLSSDFFVSIRFFCICPIFLYLSDFFVSIRFFCIYPIFLYPSDFLLSKK